MKVVPAYFVYQQSVARHRSNVTYLQQLRQAGQLHQRAQLGWQTGKRKRFPLPCLRDEQSCLRNESPPTSFLYLPASGFRLKMHTAMENLLMDVARPSSDTRNSGSCKFGSQRWLNSLMDH